MIAIAASAQKTNAPKFLICEGEPVQSGCSAMTKLRVRRDNQPWRGGANFVFPRNVLRRKLKVIQCRSAFMPISSSLLKKEAQEPRIAIQSAFVLGAGLGTRLLQLTARKPKPLIPICQKPLVTFAFDHL